MRFDVLAPVLALVPLVAGHGAVTSYIIGGTTYPGYEGFAPATSPKTIQFQWPDYNPTLTVTDPKMRCNGGTSADLSAPVNAGENVTAVWKQWTHEQGPVMVWLFKCSGDFSSCKGDGKGWFKIDQNGLSGNVLNSNNCTSNSSCLYPLSAISGAVGSIVLPKLSRQTLIRRTIAETVR